MALTRTSRSTFTINFGLAIFLALHVITDVRAAEKFTAKFITTPKDKEVFVGDSVQFDWDFKDDDNQVKNIQFGVVRGKTLDAVVKKSPLKTSIAIYRNIKPVLEVVSRTEVVDNRRASFRILNVQMNDTRDYFCTLAPNSYQMKTLTDRVHMRVVDLQIDKKASKNIVDSWKNQKVSLTCMVRAPEDTEVKFTWKEQPSNRTISRGKHIDTKTESVLKLLTSEDSHFTTYTCIAKTDKTTKFHKVYVRRLHVPGPPENLQAQMIFKSGNSYQKIFWSKPKSDGGAKITGYIIEYKPEGIDWSKATRVRVDADKTEFSELKLKEGKKYNVRVLARNKVNEGRSSNEVNVKLDDAFPGKQGKRSTTSTIKISWWLELLCLALLLKTQASFEWL